jgi:hypothetical protein
MDEERPVNEEPTAGQISRRKALKRIGAAGAAAAWSAPFLSSLRTPAFAQTESPRCAEGFVCGGLVEFCGTACACTTTVTGAECLSTACPSAEPCTTNAECETLLGPGARCQPEKTGCCGNVCLPACGAPFAAGARGIVRSNTG